MIFEVVRIGLLRLWHGRIEMLLTFVVPIVFFTIFALIFNKQLGESKGSPTRLTAVDLDGTDASLELVQRLADDPMTRFQAIAADHGAGDPLPALEEARRRIVTGEALVAVVVPEGWAASLDQPEGVEIKLLADTSDPIAPRMVTAMVQQAAGEIAAQRLAAPLPPAPNESAGPWREATPQPGWEMASALSQRLGQPGVSTIDLLSDNKANPVVSMYAAGIAVMFLLFSATGAGGSLLEEEENQTLERLMGSGLGMTRLLLGKWIGLVLIGSTQVSVMFLWAQAVFGVDLAGHAGGFLLMTLATSAAAGSFALVLAAACRTRAQLNAVSTILILTMSALGGSMAPRYVMSESMQQVGRFTFNAWAIDGYTKLFWRDLPTVELAPELAVLGGSAVVLLLVARLLATRWETA